MRVAIDARLTFYQPAGIGNYVLSLARELARLLPDNLKILISRRDRATPGKIPGVGFQRLWTPPHHRFEQLSLAAEIVGMNCDVYHAPDFIPPFLCPIPTVITVHDCAFLRMPELLTASSKRFYGQIGPAVRRASRIIAVSHCTKQDLVTLVNANARKIDVVYEAPDERFSRLESAVSHGVCRSVGIETPFALFVGTREPRKNLKRLLQAYALAADVMDVPDLAIVGQRGWLDDDLGQIAVDLGIEGRMHWLGRLPDEMIVHLYNCTVVLLYPSLYEGFGLPMVEAMACGAPVVAGNLGALPEISGGAAILVDPFSVKSIADGLLNVLRSASLREDLRGRGLERVRSFSWKQAATETLDTYRRAA